MTIVVIHGPPGSGKTTNAEKLARFHGVSTIVDDGACLGQRFPAGDALVLTTRSPDEVRQWQAQSRRFGPLTFVPIATALNSIGAKPPRQSWAKGKGEGR